MLWLISEAKPTSRLECQQPRTSRYSFHRHVLTRVCPSVCPHGGGGGGGYRARSRWGGVPCWGVHCPRVTLPEGTQTGGVPCPGPDRGVPCPGSDGGVPCPGGYPVQVQTGGHQGVINDKPQGWCTFKTCLYSRATTGTSCLAGS